MKHTLKTKLYDSSLTVGAKRFEVRIMWHLRTESVDNLIHLERLTVELWKGRFVAINARMASQKTLQ